MSRIDARRHVGMAIEWLEEMDKQPYAVTEAIGALWHAVEHLRVAPGCTGLHPEDSGTRRRGLDLFCGGGGMSMGFNAAGFVMVGVDKANQPRYPFAFVRMDALDFLAQPWLDLSAFDFIHASPPCQHYSDLAGRNGNASAHPDLVGPVRELLEATGLPYIIENVEGAPLRDPVTICGTALGLGVDGYRLRRHRCFEANFPISAPPCACAGDDRPVIDVSGGGPTNAPRRDGGGGRTYKGTVAQKRAALGIDWMTGAELVEAIPPAYAVALATFIPVKGALRVTA